MPLIDLKSDLAARVTRALNENERRAEDSSRLLKLLAGGTGITFAAKQAMLDPKSATKRLAAIIAQIGRNTVPFGLGNHIGFDPNGPGLSQAVSGTAEEISDIKSRWTSGPSYPVKDHRSQYQNAFSEYNSETDIASSVSRRPYYSYNTDVIEAKKKNDTSIVYQEERALQQLDTVPFYFTTYKVENGQLRNGPSLPFPSFFQTISDSINGNWSSFSYTGRGEQFHVYQTYGRTMQMSFKVAAFNYEELQRLHKRLTILRSLAAPTYTQSEKYMKGTFVKLTIGDVVKSLPGFLTSISYTIGDNVPWEIADDKLKLPHVIDVSVGYTVIEQTTPQLNLSPEVALTDTQLDAVNTFNTINPTGFSI